MHDSGASRRGIERAHLFSRPSILVLTFVSANLQSNANLRDCFAL
jgi:hypothetical protein